MNNRFLQLFKIQTINFLNVYRNANQIFLDIERKNKLIHPGEFGMFREAAVRDLLHFFLPIKHEISTGFLINTNNQTSTQCDIVIFNKMRCRW